MAIPGVNISLLPKPEYITRRQTPKSFTEKVNIYRKQATQILKLY